VQEWKRRLCRNERGGGVRDLTGGELGEREKFSQRSDIQV